MYGIELMALCLSRDVERFEDREKLNEPIMDIWIVIEFNSRGS